MLYKKKPKEPLPAKQTMPNGESSKKQSEASKKKKPKKSNPEQCEASENNSGL